MTNATRLSKSSRKVSIARRCEIVDYHWAAYIEALKAGNEVDAAHHLAIWQHAS